MKIFIVEDNQTLARSVERMFKQENFSVGISSDGMEAEKFCMMNHGEIDLIILDVQLPRKDGFAICHSLREKGIDTPILLLTAKGEVSNKVHGLGIGADDYLVKPFKFEELLARVHALLRRPKMYQKSRTNITPDIVFNAITRSVERGSVEIPLTPKEFKILEYLVQHKNESVSQQEIFDHCFDFAKENWSNAVEVHIKNLRKKLNDHDKKTIKTIREFGYRLETK